MLNDTICAISTALKDGAISIVRMSGEDAFSIIKEISDLKETVPNRIAYGHIIDNGEIIDEVLISCFGKGHSYTCEDMVEINCHGGVYVTKMILNLLLQKGCRLAEPGEFTKRAYLNGRIDLSEADAIDDLVRAESDIQARSAIRGLNGSIERLLTPLMDEMKDVLSMIEVNIDYPEYEDEKQMTNDVIKPYILKWQKQAQDRYRYHRETECRKIFVIKCFAGTGQSDRHGHRRNDQGSGGRQGTSKGYHPESDRYCWIKRNARTHRTDRHRQDL